MLQAGIRLLLGEVVLVFRGIAMRIIPDSIPDWDCPILFPYSPNAVIVGFIMIMMGSSIAMFILPTLHFQNHLNSLMVKFKFFTK